MPTSLLAGLIRRKIIKNGANSSINGYCIVLKGMARPKWKPGSGRYGMSPTLATGRAPPRNIKNYMIFQLKQSKEPYQVLASVVLIARDRAGIKPQPSLIASSFTLKMEPITRPASKAAPWISLPSMPKEHQNL